MTVTDKAIHYYGFENSITISIAILEALGNTELAEQLYKECLALGCEEVKEVGVC